MTTIKVAVKYVWVGHTFVSETRMIDGALQ